LTREDAQDLIERHGGRVAKSVTKKVTHALVGTDAGPTKLAKISERKLPILTEDELLAMIRAAGPPPTNNDDDGDVVVVTASSPATRPPTQQLPNTGTVTVTATATATAAITAQPPLLWTDKYAPKASGQVIGNSAAVQQLKDWLQNWDMRSGPTTQKQQQESKAPRASLLTGPPGLGKTTAATLVSRECGYEAINLNASDTRSKSTLRETVAEMLGTHGLTEYWAATTTTTSTMTTTTRRRTVLIMDEVDGMSSGDRGGLAELVQLIKSSKIPIICIANDRYKVRSLEAHCLKLPFRRPTAQQILARLTQIAHLEQLQLDPQVLRRLAEACHGDVRHAVHVLQYWTVGGPASTSMTTATTTSSSSSNSATPSVDTIREELQRGGKNLTLGPFDAAPQLLSVNVHATRMTDQLEAFFVDHSLLPLFIYENYLSMQPQHVPASISSTPPAHAAFVLRQIARAADSISLGDILSQSIRQNQNWELLPGMGVVSSVRPAMSSLGQLRSQIQFPQWLGKNSTTQKRARMVSELQLQVSLATHGVTSRALRLDYAAPLATALTQPLVQSGADGIAPIIDIMDTYGVTREGREALLEVVALSGSLPLLDSVPSTVKAAFTRTYNKAAHKTTSGATGSRRRGASSSASASAAPGGSVVGPDGELAMVTADDAGGGGGGGETDLGLDEQPDDNATDSPADDGIILVKPNASSTKSTPKRSAKAAQDPSSKPHAKPKRSSSSAKAKKAASGANLL
jgi:replication factor C subunit 1